MGEYTRRLGGGGGVPMSGTWISLGLGKRKRETFEALAEERCGQGKMDIDVPWMASRQRAKLLKDSMGVSAYAKERKAQLRDVREVNRSRRRSNRDLSDWQGMPTSLSDARARALEISAELSMQGTKKTGWRYAAPDSEAVQRPRKRNSARDGFRPRSA